MASIGPTNAHTTPSSVDSQQLGKQCCHDNSVHAYIIYVQGQVPIKVSDAIVIVSNPHRDPHRDDRNHCRGGGGGERGEELRGKRGRGRREEKGGEQGEG